MIAGPTVNIPIPAELAKDLETRAARFGMSLSTYVGFLARVDVHRHDPQFVSARKFLFSKFPASLRKLSQ